MFKQKVYIFPLNATIKINQQQRLSLLLVWLFFFDVWPKTHIFEENLKRFSNKTRAKPKFYCNEIVFLTYHWPDILMVFFFNFELFEMCAHYQAIIIIIVDRVEPLALWLQIKVNVFPFYKHTYSAIGEEMKVRSYRYILFENFSNSLLFIGNFSTDPIFKRKNWRLVFLSQFFCWCFDIMYNNLLICSDEKLCVVIAQSTSGRWWCM